MWTNEHPRTKRLYQISRRIKLQNRRQSRRHAILRSASLKDPDTAAVAIDRDPGRRSDLPSFRKLEVVGDGLIVALLGIDRLRHRNYNSGYSQAHFDLSCVRHGNLL